MIQKVKTTRKNEGIYVPLSNADWNETFYVRLNGSLVAARFLKWEYTLADSNFGIEESYVNAHVQLATNDIIVMRLLVQADEVSGGVLYDAYTKVFNHNRNVTFYDRTGNVRSIMVKYLNNKAWIDTLFGSGKFIELDNKIYNKSTKYYCRYAWNGYEPSLAQLCVEDLSYTKNGISCKPSLDVYKVGFVSLKDGYLTREDCIDRNSINVVDFPEDEKIGIVMYVPKDKACEVIKELSNYEARYFEK